MNIPKAMTAAIVVIVAFGVGWLACQSDPTGATGAPTAASEPARSAMGAEPSGDSDIGTSLEIQEQHAALVEHHVEKERAKLLAEGASPSEIFDRTEMLRAAMMAPMTTDSGTTPREALSSIRSRVQDYRGRARAAGAPASVEAAFNRLLSKVDNLLAKNGGSQ